MSIAVGFNRFLAWKPQTAFGTKATGLAKTMVPIRGGRVFDPQPYRIPRETVVASLPSAANYFNRSKILPWQATLELISPRTANDTIRDFLRCAFGKETITTVGPFTKTYEVFDPIIDGGPDTATVFFGRALTLHEQSDKSDGTMIFSHEVQDAIVSDLEVVFEPDRPITLRVSGMCSDLQDDQTDITPTYPAGGVHTWEHVRNTANSGLRIGTANPPTASDNVIFSRATMRIRNSCRYDPWLGQAATFQARLPVRGATVDWTLEVVMDVEDQIATQWDAKDAVDQWVAATGINIDLLSYISASEIFELKVSAATAAAFVEQVAFDTPNAGPQQATVTIRIAPAAQATDSIIKLTTVDV